MLGTIDPKCLVHLIHNFVLLCIDLYEAIQLTMLEVHVTMEEYIYSSLM